MILARDREPLILLAVGLGVLAWSGIAPHDRLTWFLETVPAMIVAAIILATHRRFPLSPLLLRLILLHAIVLMIGGRYTYALAPPGEWVRDLFDLSRNHYDRLGHFMQGFVPAVAAREILLRRSPLQPGKLLGFLAVCICLAFSAFYELLEWWSAVALGEGADAFLGTQGDVWDTQWDIFMALVGATSATLLGRLHDRSIVALGR